MTESWVEKHRPESFDEVQGNNKALKQIKQWAENWSPGDQPQLLVGPPGVGKTTTAYIVSDVLGYPLNQINASEARKSEDIRQMARSMRSSPADSDHQLVLLDEVDNWHHAADKQPLYDALGDPANPVILTANEKWNVPGGIKRKSKMHEFKLGIRSRKAKIRDIAEAEGIDLDDQDLGKLAERPDLRSAINDLQNFAGTDDPAGLDDRTWSQNKFSVMEELLRANQTAWSSALSAADETFGNPEVVLHWADENLTTEYRGLEAGVAYETLSLADVWLGRAQRDDYRYWKFASELLEQLPAMRLTSPYEGYLDVGYPLWFKVSQSKRDGASDEAKLFRGLSRERGFNFGGSFYEFKERYLPLLRGLDEEEKMQLALDHGLDEDAVEALGLDGDEFEEYVEVEAPQEGDGWTPDTSSAADW